MAFVGILGSVPFMGGFGSTNTVETVTKKRKEGFAKHQIIHGLDLIEGTGSSPIDLSLKMHFCTPYTLSPTVSVSALEALQAAKIPVPLFIGDTPVGRGLLTLFVIEEVGSNFKTWRKGSIAIAELDVKLLEYSNPLSIAGPLNALLGGGLGGLGSGIASGIGTLLPGALNPFSAAQSLAGGLFQSGIARVAAGAVQGAITGGGLTGVSGAVTGFFSGAVNPGSGVLHLAANPQAIVISMQAALLGKG
jgi:hypothetical protein